jgi:hypothetical protein
VAKDPNKETTSPAGYSSTNELAEKYGVSPGRMRAILSEADVSPSDRRTGRGGQHVYRNTTVAKIMKDRPGQGARSDLHK